MTDFWKNQISNYVDNSKVFDNLSKYVNLILDYNKKMNLTGFNEELLWKDGIYQSIRLLDLEIEKKENFSLLDIGAGCGFPSIPFLIFLENKFQLTIIESNKKRINFLEMIKKEFQLSNLQILNTRAEEEKQFEEHFDYVTARAVASLKVMLEISSRFGKINSKYFFLKSNSIFEEIEDANEIIKDLKIEKYWCDKLKINDERNHQIFVYNKTHKTPNKFPRKWSVIIK